MNIDKVNSVMAKAIGRFQHTENEALIGLMGEDDEDTGPEVLGNFMAKTVLNARGQVESTDDEVIDAMFEIAEAAAVSGKLPAMPEDDDEGEWAEWVKEAVENGLHEAAVSLIQKRAAA